MYIKNSYKLFLDDLRVPEKCAKYIPEDAELYLDNDWIIVRSFDEFCKTIYDKWIIYSEIPHLISFDHDLGLEHTRYYFENGGHVNPPNPDNATFKEKTGKDCANWLIHFCEKEKMPFPAFKVHSKNPIGAENIKSVLTQYEKHISK